MTVDDLGGPPSDGVGGETRARATAPTSTYRVQLGGETTFDRVAALAPYLERLGIGAVYVSPILRARAHSTHGYDVTDPTLIDERLGGRGGFARMIHALRRRDIGLVLDIVPNHMAMGSENPWWMDVLEHGRASRYAGFFDIDWRGTGVDGKVLVPILGRPYGEALEAGELRLVIEADGLRVAHLDHRLPVDPAHYARVLDGIEPLRALVDRSRAVPARTRLDARSVARRARAAAQIRSELWAVYASDARARRSVDRRLSSWSGRPGHPSSFDRLDELIGDQAYVIAYWRSALYEIDYRRFFDIPDLVSLRQDRPEVFDATHALILRLVARGDVDGLRVDHVDGLLDPRGYVSRLRERIGGRYLVVEKILGDDEPMRRWAVAGTTGYDFLRDAVEVLVDADGVRRLERAFAERTGDDRTFERAVVDAKLEVLRGLFSSETSALTRLLQDLAREDRHARDVPAEPLREAIELVTAELDVYRTYVRGPQVPAADRARIERALDRASSGAGTDAGVGLTFLRRVLLLEGVRSLPAERARAWVAFVMRWQQLSGAVTAKGLEDTALYRRVALVALNDVGVGPTRPGADVAAFHSRNQARRRTWPRTMLTTATHDTKRGEDSRARIAAISELAPDWLEAVARWSAINERHVSSVEGRRAPSAAEEWLLYQTIAGVWPLDPAAGQDVTRRLVAYMTKAMREAKSESGWLEPNEAHEAAVERFVRGVLAPRSAFRRDARPLLERIAWHGALNSLSQLVLRLTSPGVPDVYQGTELWDLSLVDPDNRRPVDFEARQRLLEAVERAEPSELLAEWRDGRVKLAVLHRLLRLRGQRRGLFLEGDYVPVSVEGALAGRVVAFERRLAGERALVVVPRRTVGLADRDGGPPLLPSTDIILPRVSSGPGRDVLTGRAVELSGRVPVSVLLQGLPVSVTIRA